MITESKIGKNLSIYGITLKKIDIDKFYKELPISKISSLECISTTEDIAVIEDEIEKWLQVPLKLTILDVQSENEHYVEKFIDNGLYIYIYKRLLESVNKVE
ncbi:MAG: hypothetical protein ACOX4M_04915 [Acetivibrionales bacterium]